MKAYIGQQKRFLILKGYLNKMAEKKEYLRQLIRVASTDLNGDKNLFYALRKIKGVNTMMANAICKIGSFDPTKKTGDLTPEEIKKIETILDTPLKHGLPKWILNRRNDPEKGATSHAYGNNLMFTKDNDLKRLKKIKCYRGLRHMHGLPVRGQRTCSNFRKNKGKITGVKHSGKKRG